MREMRHQLLMRHMSLSYETYVSKNLSQSTSRSQSHHSIKANALDNSFLRNARLTYLSFTCTTALLCIAYRLRDDARKDSDVISHLTAENEYTRAVLADTEALQVWAIGVAWVTDVGSNGCEQAPGADCCPCVGLRSAFTRR
jgi:hypothetical protein